MANTFRSNRYRFTRAQRHSGNGHQAEITPKHIPNKGATEATVCVGAAFGLRSRGCRCRWRRRRATFKPHAAQVLRAYLYWTRTAKLAHRSARQTSQRPASFAADTTAIPMHMHIDVNIALVSSVHAAYRKWLMAKAVRSKSVCLARAQRHWDNVHQAMTAPKDIPQ